MTSMTISLMRKHAKNRQGYHPLRMPAFASSPVPVRVAALALAASLPGSGPFLLPLPVFASVLFSARPVSTAVAQWVVVAPPAALTQKS